MQTSIPNNSHQVRLLLMAIAIVVGLVLVLKGFSEPRTSSKANAINIPPTSGSACQRADTSDETKHFCEEYFSLNHSEVLR